jgi:hypothetical protein
VIVIWTINPAVQNNSFGDKSSVPVPLLFGMPIGIMLANLINVRLNGIAIKQSLATFGAPIIGIVFGSVIAIMVLEFIGGTALMLLPFIGAPTDLFFISVHLV